MSTLNEYFKFFAELAQPFEARFMKPTWHRHSIEDDFGALALFLDGYAFARQGAKPDYNHVAVDIIKELQGQGYLLTDKKTSQKAWEMFCQHLQGQRLNPANNPLCPSATSYSRRTGLTQTYGISVFQFLTQIADSGVKPNIVAFAKSLLEMNKARECHDIIGEINGIGVKIASLFLRDVAITYEVYPSRDRHLLQPVDVWIRRISEYWLQSGLPTERIGKWILNEAIQHKVNPEAVNEGMWYFGSEIADSEHRTFSALNDLKYARILVYEHVEAVRQEILTWDSMKLHRSGSSS